MLSRREALRLAYHDFASVFGTTWLVVILLAFVTGGRIGRWGGLILPVQVLTSLVYAFLEHRKRRTKPPRHVDATLSGPRFVPI